MRKHLINLYQTYVSEWDIVEPKISMRLFKPQLFSKYLKISNSNSGRVKGNAMATNILDNIDLRKLGELLQQARKKAE
jgi:hypothetical protein